MYQLNIAFLKLLLSTEFPISILIVLFFPEPLSFRILLNQKKYRLGIVLSDLL